MPRLSPQSPERAARLLMSLTPGLGPTSFAKIIEHFGTAVRALEADRAEMSSLLPPLIAVALLDRRARVARLFETERVLAMLGARALVLGEDCYPAPVLRLTRPPPVIYLRGTLATAPRVAIVGARRATEKACQMAGEMAGMLSRAGYDVVSGGAYGIDAAAHRGALDAGGATTVVFGAGLDRPYPDRHIPLFEAVAERGAVLSPFRPGTAPGRGGFIARNAVIAALSEAVVVVEAGWQSGAQHTARAAASLGIPVFVVPGSAGCGRLMAEGAEALRQAEGLVSRLREGPGRRSVEVERTRGPAQRVQAVLAADGPLLADAIGHRLGMTPAETLSALMQLHLEGRVMLQPGGRWSGVDGPGPVGPKKDIDA